MGLTGRGKVGRLTKKIRETKGRVMSWEKIRRERYKSCQLFKELMWVVIDIITKTIKTIERRRHR